MRILQSDGRLFSVRLLLDAGIRSLSWTRSRERAFSTKEQADDLPFHLLKNRKAIAVESSSHDGVKGRLLA